MSLKVWAFTRACPSVSPPTAMTNCIATSLSVAETTSVSPVRFIFTPESAGVPMLRVLAIRDSAPSASARIPC